MADESHLRLSQEKDVTIVGFSEPTLLDAYHINEIAQELYDLIEKDGYRQIVLDLSEIKILSSQTLGVMINMRQKLDKFEGKLVISGIDPRLYRVFKITNLQSVFEFYENRDKAIGSFQK